MCDYSLQNVRSRPAKVGDKPTTRTLEPSHAASRPRKMRKWRLRSPGPNSRLRRRWSCTSPLHRLEGGKARPDDSNLPSNK